MLSYSRHLYHYLKQARIDVMHVHGSSAAILMEMVVAKFAGVSKIVSHSHNTQGNHNIIHKILRPMVNWFADKKLACGELAGQWMYGKNGKFTIIPNCIDTVKYHYNENIRNEVRKELAIDENTLVIGHVGMFTEIKNQSFLIHLMEMIKQQGHSNVMLLLVGHGPLMKSVENKSDNLGLSDNVLFLGNRNDVNRIMMAMDIFCLPSLFEGFPIVSVEAQASGLPTLLPSNISPEVGITDLVKLFPLDDPSVWLRELENTKCNKKRGIYATKIRGAGYDVSHSASMIEEAYFT